MTVLRTVCPHCDVVRVRATDARLRDAGHGHVEVDFTCPACTGHVVQQLNARMVPLLLSAGCVLAPDSATLADHGGITEAEIREFVAALDRHDWADELAR